MKHQDWVRWIKIELRVAFAVLVVSIFGWALGVWPWEICLSSVFVIVIGEVLRNAVDLRCSRTNRGRRG